ncbi:X-Pro dipeptidyl-peptidase domain-containing protein [Sodalis praecaptivus]|uniref:X-Pro dipeptidyl-peptidase domain-containing protein n=1 Tax=Sodalis praecaptivus TaxID=1239307 RepID=W0HPK4_9GAMM|nr:CocE/NonD family hydrolase [Sodalis praecaptivus]AHF75791.1 X-Pro dipeptidyl-peptidase domain-containing protein [Sodalis praecaptivus]
MTNTEQGQAIRDDVRVYRNIMVTMRDGVRLATDIYLPADDIARPVILERTPYDKSGTPRTEYSAARPTPMTREELAVYFVRAGYAVVWQDCRGRYGSEGEFTKYLAEAEDGYDTQSWLVRQAWCDGRIATTGLSYGAHTQMAAACLNPPGLACMALDSGGFASAYHCGIRQGGAFELKQATWAYNKGAESKLAQTDPHVRNAMAHEDLAAWFTAMPWSKNRSPVRWDPNYEAYLLEQWQRGTFDAFWQKVGIYAAGYYPTLPAIPMILMSSWYDAYVASTLQNYQGLKDARPLTLIMGPWTHGNRVARVFGDVDFGPAAIFDGQVGEDWLSYRRAFFDRCLRPDVAAETPQENVHVFLMGGGDGKKSAEGKLQHGGRWLHAREWPLPNTAPLALYLRDDMSLSAQPPAEPSRLSYRFDPTRPVPTIGGSLTSGEPIFTGGAFDQREDPRFFGCRHPGLPLTARQDVLSFETPPLAQDLAVIGEVLIELVVSTDAPDTDFTAKLVDVYPPSEDYPTGFAMNITDGIFRCRYRHGYENPQLITSEEPFTLRITPFATANLFKAGHRLRLDISSSNFPKYDVNPNSGEPEGSGRCPRSAYNTVHLAPHVCSRLLLQTLPSVARDYPER